MIQFGEYTANTWGLVEQVSNCQIELGFTYCPRDLWLIFMTGSCLLGKLPFPGDENHDGDEQFLRFQLPESTARCVVVSCVVQLLFWGVKNSINKHQEHMETFHEALGTLTAEVLIRRWEKTFVEKLKKNSCRCVFEETLEAVRFRASNKQGKNTRSAVNGPYPLSWYSLQLLYPTWLGFIMDFVNLPSLHHGFKSILRSPHFGWWPLGHSGSNEEVIRSHSKGENHHFKILFMGKQCIHNVYHLWAVFAMLNDQRVGWNHQCDCCCSGTPC